MIKYLRINITKEVKVLDNENTKPCGKELKKTRINENKCSWIGKLTIVKISILSKVIFRFNATPVKIPIASLSAEIEKKCSTIYMWSLSILSSQNNSKKKEQIWKTHNSWFQKLLQIHSN